MSLFMRFTSAGVALAVVLLGGARPGLGQAPGPAPVRVAPVEERLIAPEQQFVGTVMPLKKATVGSAVDGRVIEFPINQGDYVNDGDVLAQLLTETIGKELATAVAEQNLRQAERDEMEAGLREEEKEQARARMDAAEARMKYAQIRLGRLETLARQGRAVSSEELDEAISAYDAARGAYVEAKAGHELAQAGHRDEQKRQAAARLEMQQAVVEKLEDQLQKHTVRTRFSGYISAEFTEIGAWVNRGDPVAEVVNLDTVEIEVHVVENHVPYIKPGQRVHVTLPSLPGPPAGGAFTLAFDGQTTEPIPYAAPAAAVQAALEALPNVAPGDVTVTGSGGGPWTVTFAGAYSNRDVPRMAAQDSRRTTSERLVVWVAADPEDAAPAGRVQQIVAPPHFPGVVTAVVPQADPRSRTFPVRVRVHNQNEKLPNGRESPVIKAGMLAQVWLATGPQQTGPVVPKDALVFQGAQKSLWAIDPQTAKPVDVAGVPHLLGETVSVVVQPGVEDRTSQLIPAGVQPGQLVVVEGNERVRAAGPGKPAQVQWPAAPTARAPVKPR
jgi:multidrug efflux pump subunit AcrA (membrane-fusion protein)